MTAIAPQDPLQPPWRGAPPLPEPIDTNPEPYAHRGRHAALTDPDATQPLRLRIANALGRHRRH